MRRLLILALAVLAAGCSSAPKKTGPGPSRPGEAQMRKLEVAGVKLGDTRAVLRRLPQAKKMPSVAGREVYEIYKPNPYISILRLTFDDGRLRKMELRYFEGPTERTLRTAGGWDGLRDYLVKRFGPPTRTGPATPTLQDLSGLSTSYARFNGLWDFPRIYRRLHYIVLADSKGGVGVVTFLDTTPREVTQKSAGSAATPIHDGPNPGF